MNEDGPKVSIIVCVYNGNEFLKDLEKFVERQTFDDYELLFVVDMRSTDGSIQEIIRYCDENPKARFIEDRKLAKLGGAKNLGMDSAKGRYLWFLDVDDVPSENFLKRMIEAKESTCSDVAVCNFQYTDDRSWKAPEGGEVLTMTGSIALHMRSLNLIPVTSWAMLYDSDHIRKYKIRFRESMAEDIAFTYLSLDASDMVCFITVPLYGYYQNENSFCKKNADERGRLELKNYMYLSEIFPKENRYLQNRLCLIGIRSLTHMTSKEFRKEIRGESLEDYVHTNLVFIGKAEYIFAKLFPRTYFAGVSWYIRNFYCKTGKIYVDKRKMKTLYEIVNQ